MSSTCPYNMANFGPITAEICWRVWGTPANFNGFRVLPSLLQCSDVARHRYNQTLHDVWLSIWTATLYIHFRGLLPPERSLPDAKFTLRPRLAFSYIGSVTARHSSSGRQPNFAAWYREWNYRTFAEGASYSAGRPSRWASPHILVCFIFVLSFLVPVLCTAQRSRLMSINKDLLTHLLTYLQMSSESGVPSVSPEFLLGLAAFAEDERSCCLCD